MEIQFNVLIVQAPINGNNTIIAINGRLKDQDAKLGLSDRKIDLFTKKKTVRHAGEEVKCGGHYWVRAASTVVIDL